MTKKKKLTIAVLCLFALAFLTAAATLLPVYQGGTGRNALTAHNVILGNGTSAVSLAAPAGTGNCFMDNGTSSDPSFQACPNSGGTVTSIATSSPITGGTITGTGTIGISNGTNSAVGALKCDGTTTTCSGGAITATGLSGGLPVFMNNFTASPPLLASWSWINQGSTTAVQRYSKSILMAIPNNSSLNWRVLEVAQPSTPYKLQVLARAYETTNISSLDVGLYFVDTVSGKMLGMELLSQTSSILNLRAERITNSTTDNSTRTTLAWNNLPAAVYTPTTVAAWQLRNDGSTLYFDYSIDGENFVNFYSEAVGAFVTPNAIGFGGANVTSTSNTVYLSVIGWQTVGNASL